MQDTQKNNREEDVRSLVASEVCYIILRNYFIEEKTN